MSAIKRFHCIIILHIKFQQAKTGENSQTSEGATKIKETKTALYKKILNLKNDKEIWKVIYRILKPSESTLKADTNELNKYYNVTAKRIVSSY